MMNWVWNLILSIYAFFFKKDRVHHHTKHIVEDCVTTTGDGHLWLIFSHHPHVKELEFIDQPNHIPCNICHDSLWFTIKKQEHYNQWELCIFWHIEGIRTFKYVIT